MTWDELGSYPKVEEADNQNNSRRNFITIGFLSAFVDYTDCCSTIRADDVFIGPILAPMLSNIHNGKYLFVVYMQISNRRQIRDKGMINPITSEE